MEELNNNENLEQNTTETPPKPVEATPQEEAKPEEQTEVKTETPSEDGAEPKEEGEPVANGDTTEEKQEDKGEPAKDENEQDANTTADTPVEKVEEKEEVKAEAEPKPAEENVDELRAKIEEEKAIIAEEKSIIEFERQARADEQQLAIFEAAMSDALMKSFKDIGVDPNKSLEEIRKEDPEKARRVQQLIMEVEASHQNFVNQQAAAARERLQDIIFTRASRMFEKFKLSEKEASVVAETFVNIINEVGIKNLDDDLVAKVELAVGRAKLIVPKVVETVEQIKDIAQDVKDTVTDLMAPAPEVSEDEIKALAELKAEEKEEQVVPSKPEPVADLSEFKEGVATTTKLDVSGDSLIGELAKITDPRERVKFYKENFQAIEAAMKGKALGK